MGRHKMNESGHQNQGAQWSDTGSAGNIRHKSSEQYAAGPDRGPVTSRHGRDKSIGRGRKPRRRSVNPE